MNFFLFISFGKYKTRKQQWTVDLKKLGICAGRLIVYSVLHKRIPVARGGHGIPKVSPEPAMPNPSTTCGQLTISGVAGPQGSWPAAVSYNLGRPTPFAYAVLSKTFEYFQG
jgi:hypothetical protein